MPRIASALVAAAVTLAACGGSPSSGADAKATLVGAFEELRAAAGTTVTLSLQSTPESLQAMARSEGDDMSPSDAHKILNSSITMSGNDEKEPAAAAARISVNVAGSDAIELRMVDRVLYVRADVRRLLASLGEDAAMADAFARRAAASGLDFVDPLVNGRWIALEGMEQAMGGTGASGAPAASQRKAVDELARAVHASTTVTSEGEDGNGEHFVATISLRDAAESLRSAAAGLQQGVPAAPVPSAAAVPDEDVNVDVWVRAGRPTRIEFDLLQLEGATGEQAPAGVERLTLRADFEEFSGEVAPPADAVPVDVRELWQGAAGTMVPAP